MTRRSVTLVACASVVLMACVFDGACSPWKTADAHAQDMAGIEKLHSLDVAATLSGDVAALSEGWTNAEEARRRNLEGCAGDAHDGLKDARGS